MEGWRCQMLTCGDTETWQGVVFHPPPAWCSPNSLVQHAGLLAIFYSPTLYSYPRACCWIHKAFINTWQPLQSPGFIPHYAPPLPHPILKSRHWIVSDTFSLQWHFFLAHVAVEDMLLLICFWAANEEYWFKLTQPTFYMVNSLLSTSRCENLLALQEPQLPLSLPWVRYRKLDFCFHIFLQNINA